MADQGAKERGEVSRARASGFRDLGVKDLGFGVQGSRAWVLVCRVLGLGLRGFNFGIKVWGHSRPINLKEALIQDLQYT